jgi:hypothetical protein
VFENRVLKKILGLKGNGEKCIMRSSYLYSIPNINKVIKSRITRRVRCVAHTGAWRGVNRILVGKPDGRSQI